jgi:signal transduction histidine kinase
MGRLPRWFKGPRYSWLWATGVCCLGLVVANICRTGAAPGLSGTHLVVLIGIVLAGGAWLGYAPAFLRPDCRAVDHRISVLVLATGMVGASLVVTLGNPRNAALALPAVIALLAGGSLPLPQAAGIAACGLATFVAGYLAGPAAGFSLAVSCLVLLGGLLAGIWRSQYRVRAEQAELAAAQTRLAEQEHVRAQVLEERTRIAREIHDVLAHTLGGLVVQLDAADALLSDGGDPERGRGLVAGARRLAVDGLDESRRAITALRADPVALPEALAAIAEGDSGTQISHQVLGAPHQLPPEASVAVYRTAQEALANARKHAPGAPVAMSLSFGPDQTVLHVVNDRPPAYAGCVPGRPLAATGGGYGLEGLKERAELLGGTLQAGPDQQGCWTVELRIPS